VRRYQAARVDDHVETTPGERQDTLVCGPVTAKRLDAVDVLAGQPTIEGRDLVSPAEGVAHDRASDERRSANDQ
jgi:hypothetical protein